MSRSISRLPVLALFLAVFATQAFAQDEGAYESPEAKRLAEDAMSAAHSELAANATIVDWEQNVLKEGTNGWTCLPTPPALEGPAPMCLDDEWLGWAQALMGKTEPATSKVGIGYMLAGGGGASNIDPYAEDPTEDNDWVVVGPHLMIIVPNFADLEGLPTDHEYGGPWVMWAGTPYAHIMVPVASAEHTMRHGKHEKP